MSWSQSAVRLQLDRARRAWRGSALPGFLAWWINELWGMLPASWRAFFHGGKSWCQLCHAQGQWTLRLESNKQVLGQWSELLDVLAQRAALNQALAGIEPTSLRLALCLAPEQVLRRKLLLPLAARGNLHQVASYEMDRQTPFRAAQVYFDVVESVQSPQDKQLVAYLYAVPRPTLDASLAQLKAIGVSPDVVDVARGDGRDGADLLPAELKPVRHDRRRTLNLALLGAITLVVFGSLFLWLQNREQALAGMQAVVDGMHAKAQQIVALRKQLQDDAGAAGFLGKHKAETPRVIAILQELTDRLPDDTWVERLTINDGHVSFQGQTPQAATLTDRLKGMHAVGEFSFQGPIQKDPQSGKERFSMDAALRVSAVNKTQGMP